MTAPILFDRRARRLRRDRAVQGPGEPFVHARGFDEVIDRLGDVKRRFRHALLLGCLDPAWRAALEAVVDRVVVADPSIAAARAGGGLVADEDALPFADGSFDLVVAAGTLDGVDDLPGALLLIRRMLEPDGLMLAFMAGAGSLPRLRAAMLAADEASGGASPRMHPAIDVRTGGDLLARAGFVLPVVDGDSVDISYADLRRAVTDVRAHGAGNVLARRSRRPLTRAALIDAAAAFAGDAPGERVTERVELVHLSGWSPPASKQGGE